MSKSEAFTKIKNDVIKIVGCIPHGKITTFKAIGNYMTVMPRHVAYILSQLSPEEQDEIPWHRVVGDLGKLGKEKTNARGQSQSELLTTEGLLVASSRIANFESVFIQASSLNCTVQPAQNYS